MPLPLSLRGRAVRLVRACGLSGRLICLAESCTGGYLSKLITDVPGSSSALWGSLVVYSNQAKVRFAGVSEQTLESFGAVSEEVVRELVSGIFASTPADLALAISGVAGPGGGSPGKPVGTVWMGFGSRGGAIMSRKASFRGGRGAVRRAACSAALDTLIALAEKREPISLDNS